MSFQEKNITISLINFVLILVFYLGSLLWLTQEGNLDAEHVFRLWGIVAILAIVGTIGLTIFTHITSSIIDTIKTREVRRIKGIQDERDQLIDLKGTSVAYRVSSTGVALAMLAFVFGQPPLILFSLLIFVGVLAQIIADISRLYYYRQGL